MSLARNTATEASVASLARDTGGDGAAIDVDTVREYLIALERLMVIEDQASWAPHLRSRDIVRKAAKRHFVDPSLAAAALRASPERLLGDPNTLGLLFESLVVRDLRVYSQSFGAHVGHYRDSSGREVDAIIELPDGAWVAVEVKLGTSQVDAAAASLEAFVSRVDVSRTGAPRARMVITAAGGYAYTREDGVLVVPIGALGP
jgi:predicted AAA+ superfamily ATPase